MSIKSLMPSNRLILCHPLLLLPSIFSSIRVFSNEPVLHTRWPNYWSFSFSISPSNEYWGLISFRIDWFDLLAVHSSKAVLWHSAFFMVQLSHPYMITGKTIALTGWTFVSRVMSLLFNMLSRFVIAFLSRRKLSFNFMPAVTIYVILEPKKINEFPYTHCIPTCLQFSLLSASGTCYNWWANTDVLLLMKVHNLY